MIFPFPLFGFRIIDGFSVFWVYGFLWSLVNFALFVFVFVFVFWFLMVVVDDVAGYALDCCLD